MPARDAPRPVVIAIDGPAGAGKGTLARRVAAELGYAHLDTGLLYRAVALAVIRSGRDPADPRAAEAAAKALDVGGADLGDPGLRDERTGDAASLVAALPGVRDALLEGQRRFAARPPGGAPGAVLDGRDTGTVVCPGADVKLFVDAALEERLRRRGRELRRRGIGARLDRVLRSMEERDRRDRARAVAPLAPAVDARVIDTTALDADAVFDRAMSFIRRQARSPEDRNPTG